MCLSADPIDYVVTVKRDDGGGTSYLNVAFSDVKDDTGNTCLRMSSECDIHVSDSSGVDSLSCGLTSSSACKSIQKGIDQAGSYNTVCVHQGTLSALPGCLCLTIGGGCRGLWV